MRTADGDDMRTAGCDGTLGCDGMRTAAAPWSVVNEPVRRGHELAVQERSQCSRLGEDMSWPFRSGHNAAGWEWT
jgi:hypothetical protein